MNEDQLAAAAVAWAVARVGDRDYALRCLAFVEDAYERANQIEVFGTAQAVEALTPAPGWSAPQLIGWSSVARVLEGHRERRWTDG